MVSARTERLSTGACCLKGEGRCTTPNGYDNYRYLGSFYALFKFLKNKLTFRTSFYPDISYTYDYTYYNENSPYGLGVGRIIDYNRFTTNNTWKIQFRLTP